MIISSRTPEGEPNHCPLCGADVRIEPSVLFGDAPCPNCGHLLWFLSRPGESLLYEYESSRSIRDRVREAMEKLGVADSLDVVEIVMALEEEERFFME